MRLLKNVVRQLLGEPDSVHSVDQARDIASALLADPALMHRVWEYMPPLAMSGEYNASRFLPFMPNAPQMREEFRGLTLGNYGLQRLLDDWEFDTVVDVGAGRGQHADVLLAYGKDVTEVDLGRTPNFSPDRARDRKVILADINVTDPPQQFDCLWASHILEHQPNVQLFLSRLRKWVKPDGVLAITVPPLKNEVVSGHLNLFTPGHLLYNLVASGLDCSQATTLAYNYNLTVIVRNRAFEVPELTYDAGDIDRLLPWLPKGFHEGIDGFNTTFVERHAVEFETNSRAA